MWIIFFQIIIIICVQKEKKRKKKEKKKRKEEKTMKDRDARSLMSFGNNKLAENPSYFYSIQLDVDDLITNVIQTFWPACYRNFCL